MSFQEDVISDLTGFTLGRRFLFRPDDYRKGRGTREPADLAWHCRDTIVLMYMTQTLRGWKEDTKHNLRQANGWMRVWRDGGRFLTGSNEAEAFSVRHNGGLATVVLSITADASLDSIVDDPTAAKTMGVDLCATVSESFIRRFAERGGGISDLVALLVSWPKVKRQVAALTDVEWFETFRSLSLDRAAKMAEWRAPDVLPSYLDLATRYVRGLREVPTTGSSSADQEANALFADFSFSEQFQLLFTIGRASELVRAGAPHVRLPFEVERYRGSVVVIEDSRGFPPSISRLWTATSSMCSSFRWD